MGQSSVEEWMDGWIDCFLNERAYEPRNHRRLFSFKENETSETNHSKSLQEWMNGWKDCFLHERNLETIMSSQRTNSNRSNCRLGLRRILDDTLPIGPVVVLSKEMWLGRTPTAMFQAMKAHKSLDAVWSCRDLESFQKEHPKFRNFAMLGIDCGEEPSQPQAQKHFSRTIGSISRKLLTVVDADETSVTLERCAAAKSASGNKAKEVMVKVIRRKGLRERNSSCSPLKRGSTTPTSDTSQASQVVIEPRQRFSLEEGDTLVILNANYRYKVVRAFSKEAAAEAAIDLAQSSSSSSSSDAEPSSKVDAEDRRKPKASSQGTDLTGPDTKLQCMELLESSSSNDKDLPNSSLKSCHSQQASVGIQSTPLTFWDASWKSRKKRKIRKSPQTKQVPLLAAVVSPTSPYHRSVLRKDISVSWATICWKSLQSSRPKEGALWLDSTTKATQRIPSSCLCQEWMELLTWGYQQVLPRSSDKNTRTVWDGPKMDAAMAVWKASIHQHPKVLLSRMILSAPGGPSVWWKTCLHHEDIWTPPPQEKKTLFPKEEWTPHELALQTQKGKIDMLRLRSSRLDALFFLLKTSRQHETTAKTSVTKPQNPSSGSESSDDEELTSTANTHPDSLIFLSELKNCGSKVVLREISQAMARFWVAHKDRLGYNTEEEDNDDSESTIALAVWREHVSIVKRIAHQFVEILKEVLLFFSAETTTTSMPTGRRKRRRSSVVSSTLSDKDVKDGLWSAMDLELAGKKGRKRTKRKDPQESFFVDWLLTLQEGSCISREAIRTLSKEAGVFDAYQGMMDLCDS